jgi:hypothetical protein
VSLKLNPNASKLLKVINDGLSLYATSETEREDDKQRMIKQLVMPTKPIVSSDCAHPDIAPPKFASVEGNDSSRFCSFDPPDSQMIEQLVTPTKPIVSSDCAHPDIAPPKSASVEGNDSSRFCSFAPPDSAIVEGNDSYGIFNIDMLNEFIRKATVHSSQCHAPLGLLSVKKHMGAAIVESRRCPPCQCVLELRNCEWTTTGVVGFWNATGLGHCLYCIHSDRRQRYQRAEPFHD